MKHNTLLISCLALSALAAGCGKEPTTAQQLDKVQAETKQAAEDMKDYTFAQKNEFVAQMQIQLAEIQKDLDALTLKIESSKGLAKEDAKPKLQKLRDQSAKLNAQLDVAKNATESTWSDVKAGFKKGYGELKEGFTEARQWVSDKIAP